MGEKGSIKNLYKAWRLFLEEKKKKKKLKETKKIPKTKIFIITFFTFLFSPFFITKKNEKKNIKKSLKKIDIIIKEVEKQNNIVVLTELKQELIEEKKTIKQTNNKIFKPTIVQISTIEKVIDFKIKEIEKKEVQLEPIVTKIKKENIDDSKSSIDKKPIISSVKIKVGIEVESKNKSESEIRKKDEFDEKRIQENEQEILEFLNYMKLEINAIDYKLKGNLSYFQIKYLKSRIMELSNKIDNFKTNYNFEKLREKYKSKDKYNIFLNKDVLEKMYQKCEQKLEAIELSEKKKKAEEQKEKKKRKKKEEEFNLSEIKSINKFLQIEIKKQQLQISKIKLELAKTEKKFKKPTFLNYIKKMIGNSLKICLELIPIVPFKNRLVRSLSNAFMLNNSIRGIRNLVNDEQIEYAMLLNSINNQKDCLFNARLVYEDAITQIEFLKYDLIQKFCFTDLKEIFNKIYEVEEEIKYKNKLLNDLEIEMEANYTKTREKVKKYV